MIDYVFKHPLRVIILVLVLTIGLPLGASIVSGLTNQQELTE
jgi:hypothetical protein